MFYTKIPTMNVALLFAHYFNSRGVKSRVACDF